MDEILSIARRHNLLVIEDAAQALGSRYKSAPLGQFGALSAISFHETKNVIAGEGGALLINAPDLAARAEVIRDKGTDRSRFLRGEIDKYTWRDIGSSYAPSELTAAFLWAQMEAAEEIDNRRHEVWQWYHTALETLEQRDCLRRPIVPPHCQHNAHMYYVIVRDPETRARVIAELNQSGINAVFHYVPLHTATAGEKFGRVHGSMCHTEGLSQRLIRLPLWVGMQQSDVMRIADRLAQLLSR
jgi:dTDP-4-amino-4,6-dideoxygalactose transaminase